MIADRFINLSIYSSLTCFPPLPICPHSHTALEEVKCWEGGPYPTDPSHQDYWTLKAVLFSTILKFAIPAHVAAEALIGKCKKIYM